MKDLKLNLIVAALDRATAPLTKIAEGIEKVEHHAEKLHHVLHKLGLAEFVGGAFFTGALIEGGHEAIELADKIAEVGEAALKASTATGVHIEEMQRWQYAGKQFGVDADTVNRSFGMMTWNAAQALGGLKQARGAFKLLGISMKELRHLSNDPSAMIERIMRAFNGLTNNTKRIAAGRAIFGRGFAEIAPLLAAPREEIEEFFDQINRSGSVMSKEDAENAERWLQAKNNMGVAVGGLERKIVSKLLPALTSVTNKISKWIESLSPASIDHFTDAVEQLTNRLPALLPRIESLIGKAITLADKLLDLTNHTKTLKVVFGSLVGFMAAQAVVAFASTAANIAKIGIAAVTAVPLLMGLIPAITGVTDVMAALDLALDANPIGVIALLIGAVIAVIGGLIYAGYEVVTHWDGIVKWWKGVWEKFKLPITLAFPAIVAFALLVNAIYKNWGGITAWFKKTWDSVVDVFSSAWKRIESLTPDWLKMLLKVGALGVAVTMPGVAALAAPLVIPSMPAIGQPPQSHAGAPARPGAAPSVVLPKTKTSDAAGSHHKIDVNLVLTPDGKVSVKGAKSASRDTTVSVSHQRGTFFA